MHFEIWSFSAQLNPLILIVMFMYWLYREPEITLMFAVIEPEVPVKMEKNLQSLPTRQYLDQTVVPILLEALASLAKERPKEPIDFLIKHLENHKKEHGSNTSNPPSATTSSGSTGPTATSAPATTPTSSTPASWARTQILWSTNTFPSFFPRH